MTDARGSGVQIGPDDGDLRARPVEDPLADGMALRRIGVEEALWRPSFDGCGELPAKVDGIAEAGVHALSAEGRVHVGGIACGQDAALR
jgi:hypothetical protein